MTQHHAHLLRYTRGPDELGQSPRDVFVLVTSTEVTLADRTAARELLYDGELDVELVGWLAHGHSLWIPLVLRGSTWCTADEAARPVLWEGADPEHPSPPDHDAAAQRREDPSA